ncbi:radical SAM protein [Romboutsia sp.]|uniref:radical SAM protein n=1 Tax=Romboutsia sp. TaxID=1965302 RepID=UPI003F2C7C93
MSGSIKPKKDYSLIIDNMKGKKYMRYEGDVYRPPSEANSLIIQLTIGCARNTCTFCSMYKDKNFRVRNLEEVIEDFKIARKYYPNGVKRIFLADGDALIVNTKDLLYLLKKIKQIFPEAERISTYAAPKDILSKTEEELKQLKEAGLDMLYVGLESGDDTILRDVKKGVTTEEMIEAGLKVKNAKMTLSMTLISGLGGKKRLKEHALNSAKVVSIIKPDYVGLLTLIVEKGVPLYDEVKSGKLELLTPTDVLEEMKIFLKNVDSEGTIFRSNHASNYISLAGTLNKDKNKLLQDIQRAEEYSRFKREEFRGL